MAEGMCMRKRRLTPAALLLTCSVLCTCALFFCAGSNAVATFRLTRGEAMIQPTATPGPLAGLTVALDAGHGGYDGGAIGRTSGTPEKTLNLDVALRTERLLTAQGAAVVMTRREDIALCDENPPIRKKLQDMQRRAEIVRQTSPDILLSIHMNEYAGRGESGPQVFYREGCPAGRLLAGVMQEALIAGLSPKTRREALSGDYYILTLGIPSALVECGFLSSPQEEALLLSEDYRQRVAESIARGVCEWAGMSGRPEALEAVERKGEK